VLLKINTIHPNEPFILAQNTPKRTIYTRKQAKILKKISKISDVTSHNMSNVTKFEIKYWFIKKSKR